jgi:hypothetical protein
MVQKPWYVKKTVFIHQENQFFYRPSVTRVVSLIQLDKKSAYLKKTAGTFEKP